MKDRITSLLVRFSKRAFFVALFSMLAIGAMAQSKVTGTVLDKAGESVIGASVVVKGTTIGTTTGVDGSFTLQSVPQNGTLQVSFLGYKTVEVAVNGRTAVQVVLEEDADSSMRLWLLVTV